MSKDLIHYFLPEQASTIASHIDSVYYALVLLTVVLTIGVSLAIVYLSFRYRRKNPTDVGEVVHESHALEIIWTVIPLFICIGIFIWSTKVYLKSRHIPEDAIEISAVGKQWMWKFQHPNGRREINDLHIPRGRAIHIRVISQDVLHGLYFPAFRVKQDAVPLFYTSMTFEATRNGAFHIFCHEYCGKDHSIMAGTVYVMDPADYEVWVQTGFGVGEEKTNLTLPSIESISIAAAKKEGKKIEAKDSVDTKTSGNLSVERGKKLFQTLTCLSCHTSRDNTPVAPTIYGLWDSTIELVDGRKIKVNENYIRDSILNPARDLVKGYGPVMPSFQGRISEEEINDLIAYIKTLKK